MTKTQKQTLSQLVSDLENYRTDLIASGDVSRKELDEFLNAEMAGQRQLHDDLLNGGGPGLDAILAAVDDAEKRIK